MKLKLIDKKKEAADIISFYFEADTAFRWLAGQYLIYSLEHEKKDLRGKQRFFTISSSPFQKDPVITTRILSKAASSFKKRLNSLRIGQFIDAKGPDGDFIVEDLNKDYVFIAGGIGITPFISIIRQLNYDNKKVKITLFYSNRNKQFAFKKDLDEFEHKNPKLKIHYIYSPGRIDKNLLKKFADRKTVFYVSGPDPMVEAVTKTLIEIGISKKNIKEDYFSGYLKI